MPWSHNPNIYESYENEPLNELVVFTPPSGSVVSYTVSYDTGNGVFECIPTGALGIQCNHLGVLGDFLEGLYPIELVSWITERSGTISSSDDFANVPFEAFMQSFRPNSENIIEFDIDCTANWVNSSGVPQVDNITLKIIIWQHYDKNTNIYLTKIGESNVPTS